MNPEKRQIPLRLSSKNSSTLSVRLPDPVKQRITQDAEKELIAPCQIARRILIRHYFPLEEGQ